MFCLYGRHPLGLSLYGPFLNTNTHLNLNWCWWQINQFFECHWHTFSPHYRIVPHSQSTLSLILYLSFSFTIFLFARFSHSFLAQRNAFDSVFLFCSCSSASCASPPSVGCVHKLSRIEFSIRIRLLFKLSLARPNWLCFGFCDQEHRISTSVLPFSPFSASFGSPFSSCFIFLFRSLTVSLGP